MVLAIHAVLAHNIMATGILLVVHCYKTKHSSLKRGHVMQV